MKTAEKIEKVSKSELIDKQEEKSKGISYDTIGTTLQALNVQLDKGESIYSEAGKMSWMTQNIKMETKSKGISKALSRIITGETLFINVFKAEVNTGVVTFSTDQAGKIIPIELSKDSPEVIFQRGAFLCAEETIDLSIAIVKRLGTALFGGKGFILQKITGHGLAHLIADGEVVMYELKKGQEILVDQGNLVAYETSVDFDIQTVSGGMFNWVFGGEGIFLGMLRGPGKVWLQTRKTNLQASYTNTYQTQNKNNPIGCILSIFIFLLVFLCMTVSILTSTIAQ